MEDCLTDELRELTETEMARFKRPLNYNPVIGRFTTMDSYEAPPSDPGNLDLYLFCGADPINNRDPSGHDFLDILTVAGISASLGATFGGVELAVGASIKQSIRAAVLGAETGFTIGLALASGRAPEVVAAGIVGAIANFIIVGIGDSLRAAQGSSPIGGPPSAAKYLDALFTGFDISSNQEFFAPGSVIGTAAVSSLIGGVGDVVSDYLGTGMIDWKAAIRDTVTTAAIGLIASPISVQMFAKAGNSELAEQVAKHFSTLTAYAVTAEVSWLIQLWLPSGPTQTPTK